MKDWSAVDCENNLLKCSASILHCVVVRALALRPATLSFLRPGQTSDGDSYLISHQNIHKLSNIQIGIYILYADFIKMLSITRFMFLFK